MMYLHNIVLMWATHVTKFSRQQLFRTKFMTSKQEKCVQKLAEIFYTLIWCPELLFPENDQLWGHFLHFPTLNKSFGRWSPICRRTWDSPYKCLIPNFPGNPHFCPYKISEIWAYLTEMTPNLLASCPNLSEHGSNLWGITEDSRTMHLDTFWDEKRFYDWLVSWGIVSCGIITSTASGIFNSFFWLRRHAQVFAMSYSFPCPIHSDSMNGEAMS